MSNSGLGQIEQLTLLTYMRKVIGSREDPDITGILRDTDLLRVIQVVLNFSSTGTEDDLVHYMRLEIIWILINLFYGEKEDID